MAISATAVKMRRAVRRTESASSPNLRASASPSPSSARVYSGTKAELKAPSAKSRRKRLGKRKATKKASATGPVPRAAAMKMSRTKPRRRLVAVAPPTVAKFLRSDMRRGSRWRDGVSPPGARTLDRGRGRRAPSFTPAPSAGRGAARSAPGRRRRLPAAGGSPPRAGLGDLVAEKIGHVEDVDRALAEGRDMGRGDVEAEVRDRPGEVVEEARDGQGPRLRPR